MHRIIYPIKCRRMYLNILRRLCNSFRTTRLTPELTPVIILAANCRVLTSSPRVHYSHSVQTLEQLKDMRVHIIPALQDNYMYLLVDEASKQAAIVDPVEPEKVMNVVNKEQVKLTAVLTTHHHLDHSGGNAQIVTMVPNLLVYGNDDRIAAQNKPVKHQDKFQVGQLSVTALATPCHTSGHICYYVESEDHKSRAVFTGDTLFVGGCGKFFEGTAEEMFHALCEVLASLPGDTQVYCGHEYTVKNLMYASHVEPASDAVKGKLDWSKERRSNNEPTIPSTISEELSFNPFMRVKEKTVQEHCSTTDPLAAMAYLRKEKDGFKYPNL
ncbi:hydroxyacylglutathione hydrolase, mitochondrial-like [Dysidea avara]|uniref:hydroxyacylglutathione hydrolase, mitochondrial-like n=1 Tax=Dysidea avara TaxID=196820 RepID=UPI00332CFC99